MSTDQVTWVMAGGEHPAGGVPLPAEDHAVERAGDRVDAAQHRPARSVPDDSTPELVRAEASELPWQELAGHFGKGPLDTTQTP